ncbi:hypothetical protein HMPREF1498_1730, partial [Fusobacterium sp. CM1]
GRNMNIKSKNGSITIVNLWIKYDVGPNNKLTEV